MNIKNSELSKKFGMKVRIERTKRHFSQEKLAELANLNKNSVGAIERGESSPTLDTVDALAKAFGLSLQEILDLNY